MNEQAPKHTHNDGITQHDYFEGWIELEPGNPKRAIYERGLAGEKLTHIQYTAIKPVATVLVVDTDE